MDELKILDYFHELKKDESPILIWTKVDGGPTGNYFTVTFNIAISLTMEIGALNHDPAQSLSKYCTEGAEICLLRKDSMLLKSTIKRFHQTFSSLISRKNKHCSRRK